MFKPVQSLYTTVFMVVYTHSLRAPLRFCELLVVLYWAKILTNQQPCRRPPCDAACLNKLPCGHQCPSLCGEECGTQICPECAPENQMQQVVEFVDNSTLAEIWETEKPPPRLITLSCGHAFTVNTLDHWVKLDLCYNQCSDGLEARDGPIDIKVSTCPHCRTPISVARYTRIRKLAYQTILDQKEAQYVLSGLKKLYVRLQGLGDLEASLLDHINQTHLTGVSSREVLGVATRQEDILREATTRPIPQRFFTCQKLVSDHGLGEAEAAAWVKTIDPLLHLYQGAEKLRDRPTGSVKIFERALKHASRARSTSTFSRSVEQITSRNARELTGPRPPEEYLCRIRSILLTVEIRLRIAQLAQAWLSTLREWSTSSELHKDIWERFTIFIYDTCLADTWLANKFAKSRHSRRQQLQCQVTMARVEVQCFRFTTQTQLRSGVSDEVRANQAKKAQSMWEQRQHQLHMALQEYRDDFQTLHDDFLESQINEPMSALESEWSAIRTSILSGSVFLEVRGEEKRDIRNAFGFGERSAFILAKDHLSFLCRRQRTLVQVSQWASVRCHGMRWRT